MQPQIRPQRLFAGSCFALVSTSVAFGVITSNMDQFKEHFTLSNTQAGWIGGVTLWGFTLSIFALGPLVDAMGIKLQMRIAMACHALGVLLMVAAGEMPQPDSAMAFGALFTGGLFIALGNGTVEAACNPLVATLYPDNKTTKLNQFHVWFPGGIVIGGLIAYALDNTLFKDGGQVAGLSAWQMKLLVVLIPTVIYGVLFLGQSFPRTERVESGVTFGQMFQAALHPLFILMLLCMCLTASLELGPGRWMGTAMNEVMAWAGDNAGILVLVYGTGLMAVLRFFAGPVVHRLAPTGVLLMSAVLAGLGLYLLSLVDAAALVFLAATVFFIGVCYFWPTMLGFVAERLPRTGALGLALMGGTGMACVGLVTAPLMGAIGDEYVHRELVDRQAQVAQVLEASALPAAREVEQQLATTGQLPKGPTADAIRSVIKAKESEALVAEARAIIEPADAHGMRWGFRWTAVGAIPLVIVFGGLFAYYRGRGGYTAERLGVATPEAIPAPGAAD